MEEVKFHITVKGIVVYNRKVLLLKRVKASSDGLGYWEMPGGGLEYGESPGHALTRELKEEAGLQVDIIKPAYTFTKIRTGYQTVGIGYLCIATDDTVTLSHEHTDYIWCEQEHLKDYLSEEIYEDIIYTIQDYYR